MTDTTEDPPFLSIEWHCAQAARDARREALEEAAKVAEDLRHPNWSSETEDWVAGTVAVAAAIRALIDREPTP